MSSQVAIFADELRDTIEEFNPDHWSTPNALVDGIAHYLGVRFDLDVCAHETNAKAPRFLTRDDDALATEWPIVDGCAWCNPPYSDVLPWVEKMDDYAQRGGSTVALLKLDPSTRWWCYLARVAEIIVLLEGFRVQFVHPITGERVKRWNPKTKRWERVSNNFCSFFAFVTPRARDAGCRYFTATAEQLGVA